MSEEEKKAIEYIKEFKNEVFEGVGNKSIMAKNIDILLNLINNQQKEIEEKTTIIMAEAKKVKQLEKEIQRLEKDNDTLSELVIVNEDKVIKELDLISKDKIREKIKELENGIIVLESYDTKVLRFSINVLKELLEEK